jgi:hypothetical protein
MQKSFTAPVLFLAVLLLAACNQGTASGDPEMHQGLIGAWYHGTDLTRIGSPMRISGLDISWDVISGRGNGWSAQWEGFITAPASGEVTFYGECERELTMHVNGKEIIHVGGDGAQDSARVLMKKGELYPVNVKYFQQKGGTPTMRITWCREGTERTALDPGLLSFSEKQARWWNYVPDPVDASAEALDMEVVPAVNGIVFYEPGRFGGWPANNGVWAWGNEILVGFELGYHNPDISGGHAIQDDLSSRGALARSLDGGLTWQLEEPSNFAHSPTDAPEFYTESPGFDFTAPGFAMRINKGRMFVSNDRGKSWEGPYKMNINAAGEEIGKLTSRTDYLVLGPERCLVFMSAETGKVEADYQDRSFCTLTEDGGKTFRFLGWMTHDTDKRSVMSSTVQLQEGHLVSVMRRKHEQRFGERPSLVKNWIEAAESLDHGGTWTSLGKVAETDHGERNGNPPALIGLPDGRLVVAYGYRGRPFGIRMKVSEDGGKSWGKELVVRREGATWDLGYPRMVLNDQGQIILIYYFTTEERYEQHIEVSILDTDDLRDLPG